MITSVVAGNSVFEGFSNTGLVSGNIQGVKDKLKSSPVTSGNIQGVKDKLNSNNSYNYPSVVKSNDFADFDKIKKPVLGSSLDFNNDNYKDLDDSFNYFWEEYNRLKKEYDDLLANPPYYFSDYEQGNARAWTMKLIDFLGFTNTDYKNKIYAQKMEDVKEKRDTFFRLFQEAYANRINVLQNLKNQRDKYKIESDGLKKVGVNNPYFMLMNGPISSGSGLNLSGLKTNFTSRFNQNSSGFDGKKDKGKSKKFSASKFLPYFLLFMKLLGK